MPKNSSSSKSNNSISSLSKLKDSEYDTIKYRVEFAKTLIENTTLNNIVDYDVAETENFTGPANKSYREEHGNSKKHHTRYLLDKKYKDLGDFMEEMGGNLYYVKSGSTGHTFKGHVVDPETGNKYYYALKIAAYTNNNKENRIFYGDYRNIKRPENAEIRMIKLLSYFVIKEQTPHIVLPIVTFNTSIKPFVELFKDKQVSDNKKKKIKKYLEFVKKYQQGRFYDKVSVLLSEWANRGDFLDYLRNEYKNITLTMWKVFFFQIISVLAVIQTKYPSFRHNDMKANNILIHEIGQRSKKSYFNYQIGKCVFNIPNIGFRLKLWDFDFACIPGVVDNNKVTAKWTDDINVTIEQNRYYDMHYFFNTLIRDGFVPQIMTDSIVPQEVKNFIRRIVPTEYRLFVTDNDEYFEYGKYLPKTCYKLLVNDETIKKCNALEKYKAYIGNVHERGRLLVNDEYLLPINVLTNDPFFAEFKKY
ncbi:serine/threonine protein kinase [Hokovirus HKV1]|uniref:Serine/threonine protein kinase n=1 Tax=Hokovirus HKV1 TaxID=1977638 RepID=A0A1V0SG45_9VIRU|nr:serine/threonine protein kinase [Hokovirus HKV1]